MERQEIPPLDTEYSQDVAAKEDHRFCYQKIRHQYRRLDDLLDDHPYQCRTLLYLVLKCKKLVIKDIGF